MTRLLSGTTWRMARLNDTHQFEQRSMSHFVRISVPHQADSVDHFTGIRIPYGHIFLP